MHKKMPDNEMAANLDRRLDETVSLLRATLEATADGILVVDANGQFSAYNRRFTEMWRLPDAIMGRNDDEAALAHVLEQLADPDQFLAKVRQLYDHPAETSFDVLNFKDGRIFERYSMPQIVGGEFRGRVWSFRDVTKRESAVLALEEEVHRRRTHFAQSRDGIVVIDQQGKVYESNERFAEMLGYTFDEIHALSVWDWDANFSRRDIEAMVSAVDETGDHFQTRHRRKDGTLIDVEITTNALTMSGQKLIHCNCRDITQRLRAEASLRASEAGFRSLFDAIADGILVLDPDGRLLDANPAAETMFGLQRGGLDGMRLEDLAADASQAPDLAGLRDLALAGEPQNFSLDARGGDGTAFHADIILTTVLHAGRDAVVAAVRDVSQRVQAEEERRRLQSQLLQAQKMDALGQLTGGIAHDFNNMLGVVLGYAEMAAAALADRNTVPVAGYLGEISRAVVRARNLVTRMLAFGRAPVGADAAPQDLAPLVQDTVSMLRPTLPTSLNITMVLDSDIPPVRIDPAALQQILTNLLLNAAHATADSGKVTVNLRRVRIEGQRCDVCQTALNGEYVVLSVCDDGCGMPEEVRQRIFEPFYTTKQAGEGHGMGLAVINGLLRAYNGHAKVRSTPGQGTELRILLPCLDRAAAAAQSHGDAVRRTAAPDGRRLLVVDDQLPLAEMVAEMLTSRGYRVTVSGDGAAALELFRRDPAAFDAVLSDQTMPAISGRELLLAMREIRPDLPVMIWSGYSESMNEDIARELGFYAYLAKPVTMHELLAALDGVFADTPAN